MESGRRRGRQAGTLEKLRELSWPERWILVQAYSLLPQIAVWLRVLGFRRTQSLLTRLGSWLRSLGSGRGAPDPVRTAFLVNGAASRAPFHASCLVRSLTLWWLLRRQGLESQIRFGVRQGESEFEAHAWVERDGVVLNDTPDVTQRYTPLDSGELPDGARWS